MHFNSSASNHLLHISSTFAPMWDVFRVSSDKVALCHLELMRKMNDLIRDISKYSEEQVKIHRKVNKGLFKWIESLHMINNWLMYPQLCITVLFFIKCPPQYFRSPAVLQTDVNECIEF